MTALPRTCAVLYADVAGSARLYERLDETTLNHGIDRCLKRIRNVIEGMGGTITNQVGDEVLAIFDEAEDACQAALEMQQRIADLPPLKGVQFGIRVGMHVGGTEMTPHGPSGNAVLCAARIAGMARRDQILCSPALIAHLPAHSLVRNEPDPLQRTVRDDQQLLHLFQLPWLPLPPAATSEGERRMTLLFEGQLFTIDADQPVLTIGRDPNCQLRLNDRKSSRMHARLEWHEHGIELIDTSTNGCFIRYRSQPEIVLRRDRHILTGRGTLSFGTSHHDPEVEGAEFEIR